MATSFGILSEMSPKGCIVIQYMYIVSAVRKEELSTSRWPQSRRAHGAPPLRDTGAYTARYIIIMLA